MHCSSVISPLGISAVLAEAKAAAKAKAKAQAQGEATRWVPGEPVWDSYQDAVQAGEECKKCTRSVRTQTKGCRACMGEWFELQRQRT